jgi:hypothetical protein
MTAGARNSHKGRTELRGSGQNLCKGSLLMPTEMVAQNGMVLEQSTKISVTGCPRAVRHERKKVHKKKRKKKK